MRALSIVVLAAGCQIAMPSGSRFGTRPAPATSPAPSASSSAPSFAPSSVEAAPSTSAATASSPPAPNRESDTASADKPTVLEGHAIVPKVTGMTVEQARASYAKAGFTGPVDEHSALDCDRSAKQMGMIDCQEPVSGAVRELDYRLRVVVYDGRVRRHLSQAELRSVIGMTVADAQAKLRAMGLSEPCRTTVHDDQSACGPGKICDVVGQYYACTFVLKPEIKIATPP